MELTRGNLIQGRSYNDDGRAKNETEDDKINER